MTTVLRGDDNFDTKDVLVGVAKAWVNFNGVGTIAIRDSFGVSSITDSGVGRYDVNLSTAMSDTNYASFCSGSNTTITSFVVVKVQSNSVSLIQFDAEDVAGTSVDIENVYVSAFSN